MRTPLLTLFFTLAAGVVQAFPLTSSDGVTKDFAAIVSATPSGLVVRLKTGDRDTVVPWDRLDVTKSKADNPWLSSVMMKAQKGQTLKLDLGLGKTPEDLSEWAVGKTTVSGEGKGFSSLTVTVYRHKEVARPRFGLVWVGPKSPLNSRGDSADFVRQAGGALVTANFEGGCRDGSGAAGEALIAAVNDLFADKMPPAEGKEPPVSIPPALIMVGEGDGVDFAWTFACDKPKSLVAAVFIDGRFVQQANQGMFLTPTLFIQTKGALEMDMTREDLSRPFDLFRHYSTDGNRWCFAYRKNPGSDPYAVATAFLNGVLQCSPCREVLDKLEAWENNDLKLRIPRPTGDFRAYNETAARLTPQGGGETFAISSKTEGARHDLNWIPNAGFARWLASF